jgi:alginate O-acetyltransferase complex protein AlgI
MLFNTLAFVAFFLLVLAIYHRLALRGQNWLLLVASYAFYAAADWRFVALLLFSTTAAYAAARALAPLPESSSRRRAIFWLGIAANLAVLGFFKYYDFFATSFAALLGRLGFEIHPWLANFALPLGISFYTFKAVSYLIDVHGGVQEPVRDPVVFGTYLAYFPQLTAGPIERARHLVPQLSAPRTLTPAMVSSALQLIAMGYVKKVVIADKVAALVRAGFDQPAAHSSLYLILGVYLFALQIYCDFSGYSDISRGVSKLLGIETMVNFRQPYLARNITEFWDRWHISLSSWLRDYVFIPLSRHVRARWRFQLNLFLTMVVAGLWHGASWNYIVWGMLLGAFLVAHKLIAGARASKRPALPKTPAEWTRHLAGALITFHLICLSFILVCTQTLPEAAHYLSAIAAPQPAQPGHDWLPLAARLCAYALLLLALDLPCWRYHRELPLPETAPAWQRRAFYAAALLALVFFGKHEAAPFIYAQF